MSEPTRTRPYIRTFVHSFVPFSAARCNFFSRSTFVLLHISHTYHYTRTYTRAQTQIKNIYNTNNLKHLLDILEWERDRERRREKDRKTEYKWGKNTEGERKTERETGRNFLLIDLLSRYGANFGSSRREVDAKFNLTRPPPTPLRGDHLPFPSSFDIVKLLSLRHSLSAAATKAFFSPRGLSPVPSVAVWQTLDELLSTGSWLLSAPSPRHYRRTWRRERI